ncbi:hypothetical protein [Leisingera sp. SS27]|uniref:hypothetical protein n=1 Tax=Leisingera sp. SS27 TaxID=2979462 RepID=UPI00232ED3A4|nr:hypothetical protein [Leisingera sp. SS27]
MAGKTANKTFRNVLLGLVLFVFAAARRKALRLGFANVLQDMQSLNWMIRPQQSGQKPK